jgi:hypothetical protein
MAKLDAISESVYQDGGILRNAVKMKGKGIPTLKEISQMPQKKYEPSDAVKYTKAALAAASMVSGPLSFMPQAAGATYDLATAARYAMDNQWDNAKEDLVSAGINALPMAGIYGALLSAGKLEKAKRAKDLISNLRTATDFKDIADAPGSMTITNKGTGRKQFFDVNGIESSMSNRRSIENPDYTDLGNSYLQNNNPFAPPTNQSTLKDIKAFGGRSSKMPKK